MERKKILMALAGLSLTAVTGTSILTANAFANDVPKATPAKAVVAKNNTEVLAAQEASADGLSKIQQHAPFKFHLPDQAKLPQDKLRGAFMVNAQDGTPARHIDLFYETSSGELHIWQSNVDVANKKGDHGLKEETVTIGKNEWSYTVHPQTGEKIYTTKLNGITVQVTGKLPNEEMVDIINSLK